jgi:hypothetical protein
MFADGAYDLTKLMDKAELENFVIEIVRCIEGEPGFKVLPRRWVVERTFGWMTRWRRLVRDYEQRIDVSKAMVHVVKVHSQTNSKLTTTISNALGGSRFHYIPMRSLRSYRVGFPVG